MDYAKAPTGLAYREGRSSVGSNG